MAARRKPGNIARRPPRRPETVGAYAARAFERAFQTECTSEHRAGLHVAREWAERMVDLSADASKVLNGLRRSVRGAQRIAVEYHSLCADRPELGPAAAVAHFVDSWLNALPGNEPANTTLAEWLAVSADYTGPLRYAFPTSEWGFWKRALQQWSLYEANVYVGDDLSAATHASLRVLAGFRSPGLAADAADAWKAFVKQAKDHLEADRRREKSPAEYQEDLDAALLRGAARRYEVREVRRRK